MHGTTIKIILKTCLKTQIRKDNKQSTYEIETNNNNNNNNNNEPKAVETSHEDKVTTSRN